MKYPELNKDNLNRLYMIENLTTTQISDLLGIRKNIVSRKIREFGFIKSKEAIAQSIKQSNIAKYGVSCAFNIPEIKEKIEKTNLERYGATTPFASDVVQNKVKETVLKRYGTVSTALVPEIKEKIEKTNLEKYGNKYAIGSEEVQNKIKATNLKKYGHELAVNSPEIRKKIEESCKANWGCSHPLENKAILEKTKETCKKRYGVSSVLNLPRVRKKIKEAFDSGEAQHHSYLTRKRNNSFKQSKPEDQVYSLLLDIFDEDDIVRQYRSSLYPFNCDFYIKSLDLYIEYQGYWKHGKHPFRNNTEDLSIVAKWEQKAKEINLLGKNKNQYLKAIEVWTSSDPYKRKIAKQNDLNWKEFFTIKEVKEYIELLKGEDNVKSTNKYA